MADKDQMQGKTADQAGGFKQTDAKMGADMKTTGKSEGVDASVKPGAADTNDMKK